MSKWTEVGMGYGSTVPRGETRFLAGAWLHHETSTGKLYAHVPEGVGAITGESDPYAAALNSAFPCSSPGWLRSMPVVHQSGAVWPLVKQIQLNGLWFSIHQMSDGRLQATPNYAISGDKQLSMASVAYICTPQTHSAPQAGNHLPSPPPVYAQHPTVHLAGCPEGVGAITPPQGVDFAAMISARLPCGSPGWLLSTWMPAEGPVQIDSWSVGRYSFYADQLRDGTRRVRVTEGGLINLATYACASQHRQIPAPTVVWPPPEAGCVWKSSTVAAANAAGVFAQIPTVGGAGGSTVPWVYTRDRGGSLWAQDPNWHFFVCSNAAATSASSGGGPSPAPVFMQRQTRRPGLFGIGEGFGIAGDGTVNNGCPTGCAAAQLNDGKWICLDTTKLRADGTYPTDAICPGTPTPPTITQASCGNGQSPNTQAFIDLSGWTVPPMTQCIDNPCPGGTQRDKAGNCCPAGQTVNAAGNCAPPSLSAQASNTTTYVMLGVLAAVAIGAGVVLSKSHGPTATKRGGRRRRR